MSKLIIGIDDREQSGGALRLGERLARPLGAGVVVAAALEYAPAPIDTTDYDRARREHFDRIFERADVVLDDLGYERFELEGSPARALTELAEKLDADLIVVGSTHRGTFGRVFPGSTGEQLFQGAPCAVAIAPHGYGKRTHPALGAIGVAYDGKPDSRQALALAERLAAQLDADLSVITVVPLYEGLDPRPISQAREASYSEHLSEAVASLSLIQATPVIDKGEAAKALARHGVDLDLLVVGSHGYGPARRALLGSVGSELIRTAPCPVLVVPRAANGEGRRGAPREGAREVEKPSLGDDEPVTESSNG